MLLNCDIGESFGHWSLGEDKAVLPLIHIANIACGYHAGDPVNLLKTLTAAKGAKVQISAHPSYPDLVGFGRRSMACSFEEIRAFVLYQVGALEGLCQSLDLELSYVKPHGALYIDFLKSQNVRHAILSALSSLKRPLPLITMALPDQLTPSKNSDSNPEQSPFISLKELKEEAEEFGVSLIFEAFADRLYDETGMLVSRNHPAALLHTAQEILDQSIRLLKQGMIVTEKRHQHTLKADVLCFHSDHPPSIEALKALKSSL